MTNTIPNVPRELLENLIEQHITAHGCTNHTARQAQLMLSAPSPAGVDGLEVVGYVSQDDIKWQGDCTLRIKPYSDYTIPLCRLSEAQAIIDGLRGEVERLQRAEKNDAIAYKAAIERQGELRTERDQQARRIGELEGLLRHAQKQVPTGSGLHMRIDAALSADKEGG